MKKILIDANSIVQYRGFTHLTGIGRSTLMLLKELGKRKELPFEIVIYTQRIRPGGLETYGLPFKQLRLPFPNQTRFKKLINFFRVKEALIDYDLCHIPHNTDIVAKPEKTLFTIHDLMIYKFPDFFPHTEKFSKFARKLIQGSKAVVTCSFSSKNDISTYWDIPKNKITVIPWGIDRETFYPDSRENIISAQKKYNIDAPFFLAVSCNHPRKNVSLILEAYSDLIKKGTDHILVLLWKNPNKHIISKYEEEIQRGKIKLIGNTSDRVLRALYSGAAATLFPSLYEGFGFPVLESFACHTPVITCNNSSLSEVGGNLAHFVSETNPYELTEKMIYFEKNKVKTTEFKSDAEKHLLRYTCRTMADAYIKLYLGLLEK